MDYSFLLALLPHSYAGYASAAISLCSILATIVPQKTAVGKIVHTVAMNFGQATNAVAADVPTQPLAPIVEVPVNK